MDIYFPKFIYNRLFLKKKGENKMKLLYMGDVHERQNPPLRRIDDWQDTLDKKAEEILCHDSRGYGE